MLKESEWLSINRTLLELYETEQEKEFQEKALKMFHVLVPYTQGFWLTLDEQLEIDLNRSVRDGMEQKVFQEYVDKYFTKDYLKFTFDMAHKKSMLYRDSDILEDSVRKKTEIYRDFLRPNNIPYSSGLVLADEERIFGIFALFRSGELGDFTDKDMYIINMVKDHLTNIATRLRSRNFQKVEEKQKKLEKLSVEYDLTTKEKEVLQYFVQGMTNAQIGDTLSISESTVKKHLHNVYAKTNVRNRIQFMTLLD
jgi:DNA-binding CsgD family transcriptional regulator